MKTFLKNIAIGVIILIVVMVVITLFDINARFINNNDILATNNIQGYDYVVTIEIKQKHLIFDIENNIKDSMNKIKINIPVDKRYFDVVEIGDKLNNDFRVGSLIMSGSIGSWDVRIVDKISRSNY